MKQMKVLVPGGGGDLSPIWCGEDFMEGTVLPWSQTALLRREVP